jgi:hypothetical protein
VGRRLMKRLVPTVLVVSTVAIVGASEYAISPKTLLDRLNGLDESPWGARRRGDHH